MTTDEIFEAAARGQEPRHMTPAEDALWARARLLYFLHKRGELSAEQGAAKKSIALAKYHEAQEERKLQDRLIISAGDLWKRVEQAVQDYRRQPGFATADRIVYEIYQIQTKTEREWEDGRADERREELSGE